MPESAIALDSKGKLARLERLARAASCVEGDWRKVNEEESIF